MPDGLPCNPAWTPLAAKSKFGATAQLSNGYATLTNVQKLLDGKITQELIDSLFAQGKILQLEALLDLTFQSKYLSGKYTPLSVKGFSVVRNEANPDVDLYAVEEKGFTFHSGYEVFSGFFAGIQVRLISQKSIKQRFKLVQLGTQQGQELLKPKEQTLTYIEPGIGYLFSGTWRPRFSILVANLGFTSNEVSEFKIPAEPQVGFAISPLVTWGEFDFTLDYKSLSYEESAAEKFRLGGLYRFGSMNLSAGIDSAGVSGGIYYELDKVNAGIFYSTTQFPNPKGGFYTQTVYVQVGWQI